VRTIQIAGGRIIDPSQGVDRIGDLWQYLYKGAYWRRGPVTMAAIGAVLSPDGPADPDTVRAVYEANQTRLAP